MSQENPGSAGPVSFPQQIPDDTKCASGRESGAAIPPRRYSASRTRHHVDFFCEAPEAERVNLVGDFNGWDLAATPMKRLPDGRWMTSLDLHHGHHRYVFMVDGTARLDPRASGMARNERNERVSLIAVS